MLIRRSVHSCAHAHIKTYLLPCSGCPGVYAHCGAPLKWQLSQRSDQSQHLWLCTTPTCNFHYWATPQVRLSSLLSNYCLASFLSRQAILITGPPPRCG